jgi:hypothetical protein
VGWTRWLRVSDRLEYAEGLDRVVSPVQKIVQKIPPGAVKDALHGVWLGHPLHPVLVQVPVGGVVVGRLKPGAGQSPAAGWWGGFCTPMVEMLIIG